MYSDLLNKIVLLEFDVLLKSVIDGVVVDFLILYLIDLIPVTTVTVSLLDIMVLFEFSFSIALT